MKSYTTSSLDIYRSCRTSETSPTPSPPRRSWRGSPTTQTIRWDQEVTFATLATCYRSRSAGKKVFHTCKPKQGNAKIVPFCFRIVVDYNSWIQSTSTSLHAYQQTIYSCIVRERHCSDREE